MPMRQPAMPEPAEASIWNFGWSLTSGGVLAGVNQAPQARPDTSDAEHWSAMWRRRTGLPQGERAHPLSILKIPTAKIFEPLLKPARYKGVYGGRGSGKSHFFGELLVETCQAERGTLAVCIREAQRTLAQCSKRLIEG